MGNTLAIDEALAAWLGDGRRSSPTRDDAAVLEAFGADQGAFLLVELRAWESDFYGSLASEAPTSLIELGSEPTTESRAQVFRRMHPEASETAARLLSWAYSYDNK